MHGARLGTATRGRRWWARLTALVLPLCLLTGVSVGLTPTPASATSTGFAVQEAPNWWFSETYSLPYTFAYGNQQTGARGYVHVPGSVLWTGWTVCTAAGGWSNAVMRSSGGGGNYAEANHELLGGCAAGEQLLAIGMSQGSNTYLQGIYSTPYPGPGHIAVEWDFVPNVISQASANFRIGAWEPGDTGDTPYAITVTGNQLSIPGGPCANIACTWTLTLTYTSQGQAFNIQLASGSIPQGQMSLSQTVTGTAFLPPDAEGVYLTVTVTGSTTLTAGGPSRGYMVGTIIADYAVSKIIAQMEAQFGNVADDCAPLSSVGPRTQGSSTSDAYNDCVAARIAGDSLAKRLVTLTATFGAGVIAGYLAYNWLTDQPGVIADPLPVPLPANDGQAPPDSTAIVAPQSTVDAVVRSWEERKHGNRAAWGVVTDQQLDVAARYCLYYVGALPSEFPDGDECETEPMLVPGGKDAYGAALNDAKAIASHPQWVRLNYMSKGSKPVAEQWYDRSPYVPNVCQNRGSLACDEYPLYASSQNDPSSASNPPRLSPVPSAENSQEGSVYGNMVQGCSLESAQADGTGGTSFLVIPVPDRNIGPPTFYVC